MRGSEWRDSPSWLLPQTPADAIWPRESETTAFPVVLSPAGKEVPRLTVLPGRSLGSTWVAQAAWGQLEHFSVAFSCQLSVRHGISSH